MPRATEIELKLIKKELVGAVLGLFRIAIAAQSDRTLTTQYAQLLTDTGVNYCQEIGYLPPNPNLTEAENQGHCQEIGYLPPNPNLTEAENQGRCTWYL